MPKITHEEMVADLTMLFGSYLIVREQEVGEALVTGEIFTSLIAGYAFAMNSRCGVSFQEIDKAHEATMEKFKKEGAIKEVVWQ